MQTIKRILDSKVAKKLSYRNSIWTLGVVLLVFAVLAYSIRRDWTTLVTFHWQLNWIRLAQMILFHFLALGTMYLAWHLTMYRLVKHNQWQVSFRIFGISMLARRIPFPIWYLGSRVVLYQGINIPASVTLTASAFEVALIAISGILCYIILLPWYTYTVSFSWWLIFIPTGLLMALLIIRPGLLVDLINWVLIRYKKQPIQASINRRDLLVWGMLYLATWFLDGMGLYFAVAAFIPVAPPIASVIGISTISALIALATMALPSGFGLKELAMGAMFSNWIPMSAGIVLSFVYRFLQTIIEAIWVITSQRIRASDIETP